MGRNLIAYSDGRVAMINSQGHVIFEQPLEGQGPSLVEMLAEDSGIFSCIVRGDIVTVFKQYLQVGQFHIDQPSDLPAEFTSVFEPLQLIFNDGKLLLTVKVGTDASGHNMLSVFDIDYQGLKSEVHTRATTGPFESTSRTKNHVIFHKDDGKAFAFNPLQQKEPSQEVYSGRLL